MEKVKNRHLLRVPFFNNKYDGKSFKYKEEKFDKHSEIVSSLTLCWQILFSKKFEKVKNFSRDVKKVFLKKNFFRKSCHSFQEKAKTTIDIYFNCVSNNNIKGKKIVAEILQNIY